MVRINPQHRIEGVPSLLVRDALKNLCRFSWESWRFQQRLRDYADLAPKILNWLSASGLIERDPRSSGKNPLWRVTRKGIRLANAPATPPIHRRTANRNLHHLLQRVHLINASDHFPYKIQKAVVFGSYLNPARQRLGDLDIGVEFAPRHADPQRQRQAEQNCIRARIQGGKKFANVMEMHFWPETYVLRELRGGKRSISLHDYREVLNLGCDYRVVFDAEQGGEMNDVLTELIAS